ncbi:DEAD/DEAH box helicase [Oligoflexus tunisiensis]|uniref:DEAD/DEAH box helicase n=1 Tax=Oligoflexus tunisiensis TaxID=708132 RepID=UPI00114D2EF7|nr:DEAD/DEAH box helicase [Oligoflexus tunisiensis]
MSSGLDRTRFVRWEQFRSQISYRPEPPEILRTEFLQHDTARERSLALALDCGPQIESHDLILRFFYREKLSDEKYGSLKPYTLRGELEPSFSDAQDHEVMRGLKKEFDGFVDMRGPARSTRLQFASSRDFMQGVLLPPAEALRVLHNLDQQEKLFALPVDNKKREPIRLRVSAEVWSVAAELVPYDEEHFRYHLFLSEGDSRMDPEALQFLAGGRFIVQRDWIAPCTVSERCLEDWIERLQDGPAVLVPRAELDAFIRDYSEIPAAPLLRLPEELGWTEELDLPRPLLRLTAKAHNNRSEWLGEVIFRYSRGDVSLIDGSARWLDYEERRLWLRDRAAEEQLVRDLLNVPGVLRCYAPDMLELGRVARIYLPNLPGVIEKLEDQGWQVEADNKRLSLLRNFETTVHGDTDWLDVDIKTTLDARTYELPTLLRGLATRDDFIPLGHTGLGLLPDAWAQRYALLEEAALHHEGHLRFSSRQALLIDSLLSEVPAIIHSSRLKEIKLKIKAFQTIEPEDAPPGFTGILRDYQREGLAWLGFLQDFGFGGCLADEMGLGKTVQVLAHLQKFHSQARKPSLIVVPRSLVGNWLAEARNFCPNLRMRDLSGSQRDWKDYGEVDVALITYGTLRLDIEELRRIPFSYAILDESHLIKNESSQTAKAAFLINAEYRLALSGTPIENHLGEMRSLLRFLNPDFLDSRTWTKTLQKNSDLKDPHVAFLKKALKPLILRRTKAQVLQDLPPKVEHTIFCELEGEQRRNYDELREHYQRHLLPELQEGQWRKSPLILIEALLRLRQVACHPGLLDARHGEASSAKLEILLDRLQEICESGHKALVFSQFTSFLKIVGRHLKARNMPYLYLDGQTRDRSERTHRFQNDPTIPVFLISLKAGGVGLNLTAADYCFILDPWWNPAVEAQAIDRAHRIHQKNTVFAYRMIARDTIEEKILQLQQGKRQLAESLLQSDASLLNGLDLKTIQSLFL